MSRRGDPRPCLTVMGGPNGSGKSSIFPLLSPDGEFVNADMVARSIAPEAPETASLAAGRIVLRRIDALLETRRSFVYETTLSSRQSLSVMQRAKALGYEVALVFVALSSVDLNVARVRERVARGGHDIPEPVIRRRFATSFSRLPLALRIADSAVFFDNSGLKPKKLATIAEGQILECALERENSIHQHVADALSEVFGAEVWPTPSSS